MNKSVKEKHYLTLSFLSAISVYLLSPVFQRMAYWGEGMLWYWVGVAFTYLVGFLGLILLTMAIKKNKLNLMYGIAYAVSGFLLITGFLWITFIIIMGAG